MVMRASVPNDCAPGGRPSWRARPPGRGRDYSGGRRGWQEFMNKAGLRLRPGANSFASLRAGLRPWALDRFADRDLCAACPARAVPPGRYPAGLPELVREAPPGPWLYTGGLENRPGVIRRIARERPLWGNDADTLA